MTVPLPFDNLVSLRVTPDQVAIFSSLFSVPDDQGQEALAGHLSGEEPVWVSPVPAEGTTSFVVLVFHGRRGRTWKTDAVQVAQAAERLALPIYLERLPDGLHAWLFFEHAVEVRQARRLASALLLKASAGDLKVIKSFEQVLPGAADPPSGRILVPLFGRARRSVESVFVAPLRGLPAIPDQWALLASVERVADSTVERIISDEHQAALRSQPPSRLFGAVSASLVLRRPLPASVASRLRQRLSFPDPDYLRRKREGMSLRNVRRLLFAAERRGAAWLVPRGLEAELRAWCEHDEVTLDLGDVRCQWPSAPRPVPPGLLAEQRSLLDRLLPRQMAMLASSDDITRTTVALAAVAERGQPTLLLTSNRLRVQHWREQALLGGFEEHEVGALSDLDPSRAGARRSLIVATYGEIHGHAERVDSAFGHLVLDDCSRLPMGALLEAVRSVPAWFVLGLGEDSPRADGLDALLELLVGRPLQSTPSDNDEVLDVVLRTTRFRYDESTTRDVDDEGTEEEEEPPDELFSMPRPAPGRVASAPPPSARSREWNALLDALSRDEERNRMVVGDVVAEARQGHRCLVLTGRREHAQQLSDSLARAVRVAVAIGSMPVGRRREALRQFREEEVHVLVVTEQLMGPGFDPSNVDRLFLALPLKTDGQLRQTLGGFLRVQQAEGGLRVYDYVDDRVERLHNMAQLRRRYYRKTRTTLNPDAMQLKLPFE